MSRMAWIIAILVCTSAPSAFAREYRAKVVRVVDGDTVEADIELGFGFYRKAERIRLAGIDAPELTGISRPRGELSRNTLQALIEGRSVTLVTDDDQEDKYGRLLGVIRLGSQNINQEMVRQGQAVYRKY